MKTNFRKRYWRTWLLLYIWKKVFLFLLNIHACYLPIWPGGYNPAFCLLTNTSCFKRKCAIFQSGVLWCVSGDHLDLIMPGTLSNFLATTLPELIWWSLMFFWLNLPSWATIKWGVDALCSHWIFRPFKLPFQASVLKILSCYQHENYMTGNCRFLLPH